LNQGDLRLVKIDKGRLDRSALPPVDGSPAGQAQSRPLTLRAGGLPGDAQMFPDRLADDVGEVALDPCIAGGQRAELVLHGVGGRQNVRLPG
jgi:hypothetical protein